MGGFDFDYWKHLAENDPVAYFRQRELSLRRFIDSSQGYEESLTELQARIDSVRAISGTPMQACRDLIGMIEDNLHLLGYRLSELQKETEQLHALIARGAAS